MPTSDPVRIPIIYEEDTSGLVRAAELLQQNKDAVSDLNNTQKKAYSDSVDSIDEYTKALEGAAAEQAETEKTAKDLSKQIIDNAKNYRIFGTSLNDIIGNLKAKQAALKGIISGLRSTTGALKLFKVALVSTGIGAIVVALGSLVAFLTKTQKGIDIVNQALAGFSAGINVVIDRASKLGGALVKVFTGDFKGALSDTKEALTGIGDELQREITLSIQLEKQLQQIERASILLNIQTAARRAEIKELNLIAEDTTKKEGERIKAAQQAIGIEKELLDQRLENQKALIANQLGQLEFTKETEEQLKRIATGAVTADEVISQLGLSESTVDDLRQFEQVASDFYRTQQESLELQTTLNNKLNTITAEGARKRQAAIEEERKRVEKLNDEYQKLFQTLQDQLQSAELAGLGIFDRIEREQEIALEALDKFRQELESKAQELGIEKDFGPDFEKLAENIRKESAKATQAALQAAQDTRNAITRALEGEAAPDLLPPSFAGDLEKRFREIMAERAAKGIPDGLNEGTKDGSFIDGIERFKDSLLDALGLDEEEIQGILGGIETVFNSFISNRQKVLDAELSAQDEILARIDDRIDRQESALDRELQLKLDGYANDYDALKANLDATLAEQEAAQKQRAKIEAEAREQQERLDNAQQISSLITAGANIYKAFSAIPFVGVPLAIAAVSAMLLNFAKTKSEVKKLSRPEFGQGGALDEYFSGEAKGDKHGAPGQGKGMKGRTATGNEFLFEGGEFITNSQDAKEQKPLLHAINNGKYRGVDLASLLDGVTGSMAYRLTNYDLALGSGGMGGIVPKVRKSAAKAERAKAMHEATIQNQLAAKFSGLENEMRAVKRAIEEKPERVPITPDGYIEFAKSGNTKNVNVYGPPKRRG